MRSMSWVAFLLLAASALSAQTATQCTHEGEWMKCGPPSSAPAEPASSSLALPATVPAPPPSASLNLLPAPAPRPQPAADAKFWLAVATPQVLNAAYRAKFGSCYPTRCVEGSGLPPNQHFALFAGLNGVMGVIAYKAKKEHSRFWAPIALLLTPFSIYDLQHRPR